LYAVVKGKDTRKENICLLILSVKSSYIFLNDDDDDDDDDDDNNNNNKHLL